MSWSQIETKHFDICDSSSWNSRFFYDDLKLLRWLDYGKCNKPLDWKISPARDMGQKVDSQNRPKLKRHNLRHYVWA